MDDVRQPITTDAAEVTDMRKLARRRLTASIGFGDHAAIPQRIVQGYAENLFDRGFLITQPRR
jgi:hypothetical protein